MQSLRNSQNLHFSLFSTSGKLQVLFSKYRISSDFSFINPFISEIGLEAQTDKNLFSMRNIDLTVILGDFVFCLVKISSKLAEISQYFRILKLLRNN